MSLGGDDRFDMVCEKDHGCEPLPIGDDIIHGIQETDPRPRRADCRWGHDRDAAPAP